MNVQRWFHKRHQFRAALCGHKTVEAGSVCLLLMVQGDLLALTPAHFALAAKTGLLAVSPALAVTLTPWSRHFVNRWTSSAFLAVCTFFADSAVHRSHFAGEYGEAALTALGAFFFSVAISYTPLGHHIDRLAESFAHSGSATQESPEISNETFIQQAQSNSGGVTACSEKTERI